MAFIHGKNTYVSLNSTDLSSFTKTTTYNRSSDSHDVTTYGKSSHVYAGGLLDGTVTLEGVYDDGATSPREVIRPILGTVVTFVFRPEGTGSGKPQDTMSVLVTAYNESNPVDDMVQWTCELQMSDTVTVTGQ